MVKKDFENHGQFFHSTHFTHAFWRVKTSRRHLGSKIMGIYRRSLYIWLWLSDQVKTNSFFNGKSWLAPSSSSGAFCHSQRAWSPAHGLGSNHADSLETFPTLSGIWVLGSYQSKACGITEVFTATVSFHISVHRHKGHTLPKYILAVAWNWHLRGSTLNKLPPRETQGTLPVIQVCLCSQSTQHKT